MFILLHFYFTLASIINKFILPSMVPIYPINIPTSDPTPKCLLHSTFASGFHLHHLLTSTSQYIPHFVIWLPWRTPFYIADFRFHCFLDHLLHRCGYREKWTLIHFWWDCWLIQPFWKTLLKILIIGLPYDPAISFPGIYTNRPKFYLEKIFVLRCSL